MSSNYIIFLILLLILGVLLQQDFIFTIIYLLAGVFVLSGWWSRKALADISFSRQLNQRAFLNEEVPVQLAIMNKSWLPVLWARVSDSMPSDLAGRYSFRHVISLAPYGKTHFSYTLYARKRGYYPIGPFFASSGDLLGILDQGNRRGSVDYLTVYPKIIPFTSLPLPSSSPQGTLRHSQPIFEDPTRVLNKRDYVSGDSLRRIDWKSSASLGRLQVKQFEPSISLEVVVFLDLDVSSYDARHYYDQTELAIVVAASVANWVCGKNQAVGLITNGLDVLEKIQAQDHPEIQPMSLASFIPAKKGRAHLIRILETLARLQSGQTTPFRELVNENSVDLPWGSTLVLVTGLINDELFDTLFQVQRRGLHALIINVGSKAPTKELSLKASSFKLPLYRVQTEMDLDMWRY